MFQKFISAKMMLTQMQLSRLKCTAIIIILLTVSPALTVALARLTEPKKFYETFSAQEKNQFRDGESVRSSVTYLLRRRWQSHPQAEEATQTNSITASNFSAMKNRLIILPVSWFLDRIGETVMFYSQGWYVLSEIVSDEDAHMKWLSQRNQGLQWFEAPDEVIDQLKALQP